MAHQLSAAVRDAQANALEATIGASPILRLRSGAAPANAAAADTGTVIAEMTLPSDWLTSSSGGAVSKSGVWDDPAANAAGTIGHFRIYNAAGTVCHMQGSVTASGGGGDMTVDNPTAAVGQDVLINTFTYTRGNA